MAPTLGRRAGLPKYQMVTRHFYLSERYMTPKSAFRIFFIRGMFFAFTCVTSVPRENRWGRMAVSICLLQFS